MGIEIGLIVHVAEERCKMIKISTMKCKADLPVKQETGRFRAGHRNRHRAVEAALVKPVGQQPIGVLAFLEKIDGPGELDLVVDRGKMLGVFVGAMEMDER